MSPSPFAILCNFIIAVPCRFSFLDDTGTTISDQADQTVIFLQLFFCFACLKRFFKVSERMASFYQKLVQFVSSYSGNVTFEE